MIDRIQDYAGEQMDWVAPLQERALDWAALMREQAARGVESVRDYTRKQPARALAIALGTGVALGWLIKRR
jgi:hypothetical protein